MELFQFSALLYEAGDIIQPRTWGRVVMGHGPNHSPVLPGALLRGGSRPTSAR